jgi:TolB-like protein/tetratricopeptide (TPR) repeat protein
MGSLFSELKRRKVFRVTAAYLVGAWAILEFVSVVTPMLRLPEWAGPFVLMLLTIGFVTAVALSWMFEMTADGLRRTEPAAGSGGMISKFDWALMSASVAIIALVSYQQIFARSRSAEGLPAMSGPTSGSISIAVLPFVNLSSDPEQEFFSDGMTEEITSALARVKDLQVVGRTSAFEFKGQNKDLRAIGQALGAANILEGSVRKEGNQIRVTAQLIRADNGRHIWTDNYDRELKGVFAIQDEIAQAIAGALRVPLGLGPGETLIASRTADPETYQQYLRAKALVRARTGRQTLTEPVDLLERVVTRDSAYAAAWALLGLTYSYAPLYGITYTQGSAEDLRSLADVAFPKAEAACRRALALDARNAEAYACLGNAQAVRGRFAEAEDFFKQALTFDVFNPETLHLYSLQLGAVGRLREAIAMREQLRLLEPLVPQFNSSTANLLLAAGHTKATLAILDALPSGFANLPSQRARLYAAMGRYAAAADAILAAPVGTFAPGAADWAARLLRAAPARTAPQDLPDLRGLEFVYLYAGAPERSLDPLHRQIEAGYQGYGPTLYHPSYSPARKTDRFKALALKSGLVEYWRARGWPDACRPVGADDFVCD